MISIADLLPAIQALQHNEKIRLMSFLIAEIANEEGVSLVRHPTDASESVDALEMLSGMAQPIGPKDLSRNFDRYVGKVLSDESTQ